MGGVAPLSTGVLVPYASTIQSVKVRAILNFAWQLINVNVTDTRGQLYS